MYKKIILPLALLFASIIVISYLKIQSCNKASCILFKDKISSNVKEIYKRSNISYSSLLKNNNLLIRIETFSNYSLDESEAKVKERTTKISSQFDTALSPYPGEISNQITCSDEFKVHFETKIINDNKVTYGKTYLNDRFVSGTCDRKQNTHVGILAYIYCPSSRTLAQVEFITPNDTKYDKILYNNLHSLECAKPFSLKIPGLN